jgi:hypothetical protein
MKSYADKLKDPRWQKKRLAVLERDQFRCQFCGNEGKELHVHHLRYDYDKEPWELQSAYLLTLCCDCHIDETDWRQLVTQSAASICESTAQSKHVVAVLEALQMRVQISRLETGPVGANAVLRCLRDLLESDKYWHECVDEWLARSFALQTTEGKP